MPDSGQAVTLRIVFPHASRVVNPAVAKWRVPPAYAPAARSASGYPDGRKCTTCMARIFFQHIRDDIQLRRVQAATGQLDAHHVDAFLPLAINPHLQAGSGKAINIHAQALIILQRLIERIYFLIISEVL